MDMADEFGHEIEAKREAEKIKQEAVEQSKKEAAEAQKKHEHAKSQGMI